MVLTDYSFGTIILCPDANPGGLKYTANSLQSAFPGNKYVAVVGKDVKDKDVRCLCDYSKVYKGGNTITSLIDEGMQHSEDGWCLVIMSGSIVKFPPLKKYFYFAEDKCILYPVINRKYIWDEASINGIMMKKSTHEDIGCFGDDIVNIREAKLLWAERAMAKGYKFKALVGTRFF